jgi:uncharacterized membrane-anchored protein
MILPQNHPQRVELNDEVHARPPEPLAAPVRISYLAMLSKFPMRQETWAHVCELAGHYGMPLPAEAENHYSVDLGPFRLKWERHTEFYRYTFIAPGVNEADPFASPALSLVPASWVKAIPGELMMAAHAALVRGTAESPEPEALSNRVFDGNVTIGSSIAGGAGRAFTDFRIKPDGFSRILVEDLGMTQRQAGRIVQRLLEIDTYRLMALLAFPVARELGPFLAESEQELAQITSSLTNATERDDPILLDRLTRLEAAIEKRYVDTYYRFSAASAYYDLVQRRIAELREERIEGLQTFEEFTERRLAPAISTCRTAAERQEAVANRVARVTQLLSTKIDVARKSQNQAVLESLNRRARAQLRLQQTVEGLSVAAVTYYIVGLIGYAAKGLQASALPIDPDIVMGVSIPVVVIIIALGIRQVRRRVAPAARADNASEED